MPYFKYFIKNAFKKNRTLKKECISSKKTVRLTDYLDNYWKLGKY